MKDNRPVNIDLTTFKFPLPAITSILHRISGVVIFAGVALLLYLLQLSLESAAGFAEVAALLDNMLIKFLSWSVLAALLFHLIAGIKHLLMDMGIGESLAGGVLAAKLTLVFSCIAMIAAAYWLW
ncbi:MAG: succinate dehydrogenase, cytochrome b556 subunit [Proteobacteria bacterium]|nr:succinate dehydrogenase, cytochrome b556 subunit [Pseudomonadota bacterium]